MSFTVPELLFVQNIWVGCTGNDFNILKSDVIPKMDVARGLIFPERESPARH